MKILRFSKVLGVDLLLGLGQVLSAFVALVALAAVICGILWCIGKAMFLVCPPHPGDDITPVSAGGMTLMMLLLAWGFILLGWKCGQLSLIYFKKRWREL